MVNATAVSERLTEFIREETGRMGYELVNISVRGSRGFFLEVVIDKEGGVTLDECGDFNKSLAVKIDDDDMFPGGYTMDVCSPGLDRVLKSEMELQWATGRQVEVRVREPLDTGSAVIGKLVKVDNKEGVTIETADGKMVPIDRDNVAKIKLWMEK